MALAVPIVTKKSLPFAGPLFVLGYCILASAKAVTVGHMLQSVDAFLLVFANFLLATTFFCFTERNLFKSGKLEGASKDILWLNVTTTLSWIGFYFALKELEPAVQGAIVLGFGPLFTGFLIKIFRPKAPATRWEIIAGIGVLLSMIFLGVVSLNGQSALPNLSGHSLTVGVIAALIAGLGVSGNTVFSKRLSDRGMTARQIMAVRFFMLLVISFIAILIRRPECSLVCSSPWLVLVIAGLGVILPLYLLQRGIVLSEPMVVALLLPMAPVMTMLFQWMDPRLHFSGLSLLGVLLVTLFGLTGTLQKYVKR